MNEPRTRIDDAIDRAVRDLMRREPPAGFRRRVLSRLNAPVRRSLLWPGLATAAAVAIIAIVSVVNRDVPQGLVSRPPEVAPHASANAPAPPVSGPQPQVAAPSSEPVVRRPGLREPVRTATFGPRDGRVSATSLRTKPLPAAVGAEELASEEPLPSAPPIAVPPLPALPPLEIAPIVVAPIQIPRVQLAPLSPPR